MVPKLLKLGYFESFNYLHQSCSNLAILNHSITCDKNYQKPKKRKLNEDLEENSIESPAKRRAPVQNICDTNEAPEVQNKVKIVQIGPDSPQDSPWLQNLFNLPNPQTLRFKTFL